MKHVAIIAALAAMALAGCGAEHPDREIGGAAVGAGTGAAIGAIAGGIGAIPGALIGAAVGAGTGAVTDEQAVDLGEPLWSERR